MARTASDFADFDFDGVAVAFASLGEPFTERGGESRGIDAQAGFKLTFTNRQGVVEFSRAREIPHAEAVQPIERARAPLAADDNIHLKLSRKHRLRIIAPRRETLRRASVDVSPASRNARCLAIPLRVP